MARKPSTSPRFFATPADFRAWLAEHHAAATELLVGMRKTGSGQASMSWPESVDEALCFGWIDGVRRRIDDTSYSIRFTPRKPGSIWSAINIAKVEKLSAAGLMAPAGVAAFGHRSEAKSVIYSYEQRDAAQFDPASLQRFRAEAEAWRWFEGQSAAYRHLAIWRVISAKREETRAKRLAALIAAAARGERG